MGIGAETTKLILLVAEVKLSCTLMLTLYEPLTDDAAVPKIIPEEGFIESPDGKLPCTRL